MRICRATFQGKHCYTRNRNDARSCVRCGSPLSEALCVYDQGTEVGRYRILRLVGFGNFGSVYEAEVIRRPDVHIALKETLDPNYAIGFEYEFAILQQLRHIHLPRYYEMFEHQGRGCLSMEFVPGQSLYDILERERGPVLEFLVLSYAEQLCSVMEYLHTQHPPILHRDIKPHNVRLTPEGLIKLVDFGLVKRGTQTTDHPSAKGGTLAYSPLEQWLGGTDQRSDIYSFGATLYHLLTGQPPIPAARRQDVTPDPLPHPQQINPRLSPTLVQIINRAMDMERGARFAAADEIYDALVRARRRSRATRPIDPFQVTFPPTSGGPPRRESKAPPDADANDAGRITPKLAPRQVTDIALAAQWSAHDGTINAIAWHPQRSLLASVGDDWRILVWQLDDQQNPPSSLAVNVPGPMMAIAWNPAGTLLASGGRRQILWSWDGSLVQRAILDGHQGNVFTLDWSRDGRRLASGGWDKTVRIWRAEGGALLRSCYGHQQNINSVAWSPDSDLIASGSNDSTVRIWDVQGRELAVLQGHTGRVFGLSWRPDGSLLASAGSDTTIRLWDAKQGKQEAALRPGVQGFASIGWSPDGSMLAATCEDHAIWIWCFARNDWIQIPQAHRGPLVQLAWRADGTMLASASADGSIHLWKMMG